MKKISYLFVFIVLSTSIFAQEEEFSKSSRFGKQDRLSVDIYSDIWQNKPSDINFKDFNPGAAVNLMEEFRLGSSNFHFAVGLGISAHNLYMDASMIKDDSTGITSFVNFPDNNSITKNKFVQSYIDIPLEFRFRTERKTPFRVTIGGKIGIMTNNHIKTVTKDTKFKQLDIDNINHFHYGLTARIGYGIINVYAYYGLSEMFKSNKGPDMTPISVGISILPF